jgi:Protein of unknown function (DUF3710)
VPDDSELDSRWTTSTRTAAFAARKSTAGPYDADDPDAPDADGALDFGSLRVPLPAKAQLQVEKGAGELLRAVHVLVPSGRVSLSALAAPRSSPLWRELADEIAGSLSGDGARVRSEWGEWGREVQAGSNGASSRFIGVDGPRWMLYGVATGPADGAAELAHTLREMIRDTVVSRGADPLPVKTVLPLRLPEHLEEMVEVAREHTTLRSDTDGAVLELEPDWDVDTGRPEFVEPAAYRPADQPPAGSSPPAVTPHAVAPEFDDGRTERSIGIRRSELRPVTGHRPGPPRQLPAAARAGLPPVPSIDSMDTDGFPVVSASETTWSMAVPVVSSDEVEHQPAWAELDDAPSYWPRPYLPGDSGEGRRSEYRSDQFGISPGDVVHDPPERRVLDDLGFGLPPTGLDPLPGEPGGSSLPPMYSQPAPARYRTDPLGAPPDSPGAGPDPTSVPPPWQVEPHRPPDEPPPGPGEIHDSLHDALTSDAALTHDRPPRVARRAKHRRPD